MRAQIEYRRLHLLVRPLTVGIATGTLLGFTAPYETGLVFSTWERFAFWIWSSVAGALLLTACDWVARGLTKEYGVHRYVASAAALLTAAVPTTLIVHATAPAINDQIRLLPFWQLFPSVLILCIPVQIVLTLLSGAARTEPTQPDILAASESRSPLLDKIPAALGRDVLCMKMEDHYLRVFTAKGDALILMRMSDAEASLDAVSGQRVHRSWWVARSAVKNVRTADNNCWLILSNGLEVPVSRSRREALRDKGWFR